MNEIKQQSVEQGSIETMHSEPYVSTPRGIFTRSGLQFHTTEPLLQEFAGEVLKEVPLSTLISQTEMWLRSPTILGLVVLPLLLLLIPIPILVALLTLAVYFTWEVVGPGFSGPRMAKLAKMADNVFFQFVLYAVCLGILSVVWQAAEGVIYGLAGFVLFRWNIISRMLHPLYEGVRRSMYSLPVADHVLRLMIIRTAMGRRIPLDPINEMEQRVLKMLGK